jgi:hypothetical protein
MLLLLLPLECCCCHCCAKGRVLCAFAGVWGRETQLIVYDILLIGIQAV